jgi:OOP family OmpA-OmpF porin
MKKVLVTIICMLFVLTGLNIEAAEKDVKGSADHPLLTRMPDFHISSYSDKDFDKHEFLIQDGKKISRVSIEGHKYYIQYSLNQGAKGPGDLKVVRNIENALKKSGAKSCLKVNVPGVPLFSLIKTEKKHG